MTINLDSEPCLHYSRFPLFARANSVNNQWFTDSIQVQNHHFPNTNPRRRASTTPSHDIKIQCHQDLTLRRCVISMQLSMLILLHSLQSVTE
jgi:hypothetical protein